MAPSRCQRDFWTWTNDEREEREHDHGGRRAPHGDRDHRPRQGLGAGAARAVGRDRGGREAPRGCRGVVARDRCAPHVLPPRVGRPGADLDGADAGRRGARVRRRVRRVVRHHRREHRSAGQLPRTGRRPRGLPAAGHGDGRRAGPCRARRQGARRVPAQRAVVVRQHHPPRRVGDVRRVRLRERRAVREPGRQQPARVTSVPGAAERGRDPGQLGHHGSARQRQLGLPDHGRVRAGRAHADIRQPALRTASAGAAGVVHAQPLRCSARRRTCRSGLRP